MNLIHEIIGSFIVGLFSLTIIGIFGFGSYYIIKDFINDEEARIRTLIISGIIIFCTIFGFILRLFL